MSTLDSLYFNFYIIIVQGTDRRVHFLGFVQWFKQISLWVLGPSLCPAAPSVSLHVIWFLFKWHLSASVSRPTGMASGWRTAGVGEPAVRWASPAPTAETRDREAPPFKDKKKATHEQGWHADRKEKTALWRSQPCFPGCNAVIGRSSRVRPFFPIY